MPGLVLQGAWIRMRTSVNRIIEMLIKYTGHFKYVSVLLKC